MTHLVNRIRFFRAGGGAWVALGDSFFVLFPHVSLSQRVGARIAVLVERPWGWLLGMLESLALALVCCGILWASPVLGPGQAPREVTREAT